MKFRKIMTVVLLIALIICLLVLLGICAWGVFSAEDLWQRILCFVFWTLFIIGLSNLTGIIIFAFIDMKN